MVLTVLYSIAGLGIAIVNDFKSIEGDRCGRAARGVGAGLCMHHIRIPWQGSSFFLMYQHDCNFLGVLDCCDPWPSNHARDTSHHDPSTALQGSGPPVSPRSIWRRHCQVDLRCLDRRHPVGSCRCESIHEIVGSVHCLTPLNTPQLFSNPPLP